MNMRLVMFLMCIGIADFHNNYVFNILKPNVDCFDKINFDLFYITNTLFSLLNIHNDFTNSSHVQMLIKMLDCNKNKLITNDCRVFKELRNMSVVDVNETDNSTVEGIVQRFVTEEINVLKNIIMNKSKRAENGKLDLNGVNVNFNKENASEYIKFLVKVNPTENEYDVTRMNKITNNELKSVFNKRRIIKSWKPPDSNKHSDSRRIYRGKKSKIKDYSFLVSIHIMSEFMCSGSIISKDMVITSASCLKLAYENKYYRDNPRTIFVRIASDYTKRSGELIPIVQVIFHPKYEPVTLKHNVAIIRMLSKIKLAKRRKIKRIRYNTKKHLIDDNVKEVTILGWGINNENQKLSKLQKLKMADLDVYDFEDCQEIYSKYYVTETNFCAGFTNKGGGACTGDVGGPALANGVLVGIVSFGPTVCGMTDAPTVFTDIENYSNWIEEVVNKGSMLRNSEKGTASYLKPNLLLAPTFTTLSQIINSVAKIKPTPNIRLTTAIRPVAYMKPTAKIKPTDIINPVAKIKTSSKIKTSTIYPENIMILKKIINEFILSNSTILDYLVNGDGFDTNVAEIDESDDFFDPDISEEKLIMEGYKEKKYSYSPDSYINFDTDGLEIETMVTAAPNLHMSTTNSDYKKSTINTDTDTLWERFEVTEATLPDIYEIDDSNLSDESSYYEEGMSVEIPNSFYKMNSTKQQLMPSIPSIDYKFSFPVDYVNQTIVLQKERSKHNYFDYKKSTRPFLRLKYAETYKKNMAAQTKKTTMVVKKFKNIRDVYPNIKFVDTERYTHSTLESVKYPLDMRALNQTKERNKKITQHKQYGSRKPPDFILKLYKTEAKSNSTNKSAIEVIKASHNDGVSDLGDAINSKGRPLGLAMNISDESFDYIDKLYHEEKGRLKFNAYDKKQTTNWWSLINQTR